METARLFGGTNLNGPLCNYWNQQGFQPSVYVPRRRGGVRRPVGQEHGSS